MSLLSTTLAFAAFTGVIAGNNTELKVRVVTWNVNSNFLPANFTDLLGVARMVQTEGPEMIVVGLQNLGVLASEKDNEWIEALKVHVNEKSYYPIEASIRKGNGFVIFLKVSIYSNLELSVNSRGVNLKWLSKDGAIITNFKYLGKQFTFVGLQLDKKVDEKKRVEEYEDVKKNIKENYDRDSDFVFWLGNLNFKIELNQTKAKEYIEKKDWTTLLTYDQLKKTQKEKKAFEELTEQNINFGPTFKFKPATDKYNWEETPSWADRILFRSKKNNAITPVKYESIEKYKESDHKPVVGEFILKLT
ncbi:type II inositol 1,4,5-trisphosphate 5-phosphatase-like [Cimex lectularius]|uniref:Inositol polyphosphate-related phosphatase domain-containing protein n=1 Tax=Cimex lectularius TaxID=79782 RepID=A0A8I6RFL9_CIMLE|nr:type II inositol 1,4,5-trisphosphate 5-phosphatase-like [Cimex lectularius]